LNLTIKNGARLAQKGEFTKRAFLSGKLDISQAEAVLDLIPFKNGYLSDLSANNLSGRLSGYLSTIKKEIFDLYSKIIAAVDFPEDVAEPHYEDIEENLISIISKLDSAIKTFSGSNLMRQGIKAAIAGKPNAGKSSLFNALLDMERAIVTNIPGTTRTFCRKQ
jgi:tRNA modification GTPase